MQDDEKRTIKVMVCFKCRGLNRNCGECDGTGTVTVSDKNIRAMMIGNIVRRYDHVLSEARARGAIDYRKGVALAGCPFDTLALADAWYEGHMQERKSSGRSDDRS